MPPAASRFAVYDAISRSTSHRDGPGPVWRRCGGGTLACTAGARVTVTDLADEAILAPALASLGKCPNMAYHLGGHRECDFRETDLVVVNPAVRPNNPWLNIARQNGVPLTTEIDLLLQNCPAATVGVTGSNGKSTTAAMIAAILKADGRCTWVGGNIGSSLLNELDAIRPDDGVVLELSSFQLTYLRPETRVPHIGVITSFSPNHLDWHASMDEYAAAKRILFQRQQPGDMAVINTHDRRLASWTGEVRGRLLPLVNNDELSALGVPGWHNRMNAICAATAAAAAGCSRDAIHRGLLGYRGLPQRMELIADIRGRRFYNDSTSTTPESTIAALESLDCPAILMAGGRDKGFDFSELIETIGRLTVARHSMARSGQCSTSGSKRRTTIPWPSLILRSTKPWLGAGSIPSRVTRSCSRPAVRATINSGIFASGERGSAN